MSNIINIGGGAGAGSGHNYSTTEQVVGTWIDGSTLYEKTFVFTGTFFGDVLIGNINTSDIGELIDISGNMLGSDGTVKPLIFAHANARNNYGIFITTNGDVNLKSGDGYTSTNYISKCILTLRYTKSST